MAGKKVPIVSKMLNHISGNTAEKMILNAFKILGTKMFITELFKIIKNKTRNNLKVQS